MYKIVLKDQTKYFISDGATQNTMKIICQDDVDTNTVINSLSDDNLSDIKVLNNDDLEIAILTNKKLISYEIDVNVISIVLIDKDQYESDNEVIEPLEEPLTLEDIKNNKIEEMNVIQQQLIENGVDITLSDGTTEHFDLTANDQISLMGLQSKVIAGDEMIPWHTSNDAEHCKFYSNTDMQIITNTALIFVSYNVTYFRDLRIYINSLNSEDEVNAIVYGMPIPEQFQSEPLKAMLAQMNA